jgi:hypothetical protein
MRKFRITVQRKLFTTNEVIDSSNRTYSIEIECDSYKENIEEVIITQENIEYAKKYLNSDYKVGQVHKSPTKSIIFIESNETKEEIHILGDPYYKLDEFIDSEWKTIDKHRCLKK